MSTVANFTVTRMQVLNPILIHAIRCFPLTQPSHPPTTANGNRVRELPAFGHPPDVLPAQILSRPDVVPVQVGVDEQELLNAHRNAPDGKLHVHKCLWDSNGPAPCDMWVEGTRISISRHLQNWHGVGPCDKRNLLCLWGDCGKELQGENMARHLLSGSHLEAKVACSKCKSPLAREDAFLRHKANSSDCKDATMIVRPGSGGRDVDSCLIFGPRAR
ncbi:hypothetical protein BV22DRAFT_122381 [Leucogyrophana mollusca]|uniref:Uncharacterized protein n=1 Tax=Leucogyrophana mollusca TaxID=85980 RepID=A0ACB8BWC3_9AGAM|nr:hypothetical protein BV22DRAFT_122381 [Leucogyrophana mollusca]